jgi:hypothetical protein
VTSVLRDTWAAFWSIDRPIILRPLLRRAVVTQAANDGVTARGYIEQLLRRVLDD